MPLAPKQPSDGYSGRDSPTAALPLSATSRGRAVTLLLFTGIVMACFVMLALTDPVWGGQPRGGTAACGAALFAVPLIFLCLTTRRIPAGREAAEVPEEAERKQRRSGALTVVAAVLWAMAALFWYLTFAGVDARWSLDPILLAVPLTIYPFLVFFVRPTHSAKRLEEPGT